MEQGTRPPRRPRDELGRPLPRGSANRLQLEDFEALSPAENHRLGLAHFRAERYFEAHEAWETSWKQSGEGGQAEAFKGLAQLAAGYVHLRRGNRHGAITLLRRGAARLQGVPDAALGQEIAVLATEALLLANALELG